MRDALGDRIRGQFARPPEVVLLEVEPVSGALALPGCPVRRSEYFVSGTEPEQTCPEGSRRPAEREGGGLWRWFEELL